MFEYLMPLLVMPTYEHTLLDETYQAVVRRQIEYGRERVCRGESPNPDTPRPMRSAIINIRRSVFRGWDSNGGWRTIWYRTVRHAMALMVDPSRVRQSSPAGTRRAG